MNPLLRLAAAFVLASAISPLAHAVGNMAAEPAAEQIEPQLPYVNDSANSRSRGDASAWSVHTGFGWSGSPMSPRTTMFFSSPYLAATSAAFQPTGLPFDSSSSSSSPSSSS